MNTKIWCGLDVSKNTFAAAIDFKNGKNNLSFNLMPRKDFKRTSEGVDKFYNWIDKVAPNAELAIVMETTGCYSQILARLLKEKRPMVAVTVENAYLISNFIKSLNLKNKTDDIDAKAITQYGRERTPAETQLPSNTQIALSELNKERRALINNKIALSNRADSITLSQIININNDIIHFIDIKINEIKEKILEIIKLDKELNEEFQILISLPGVGEITACGILAEFGSLKQYSRNELSALSGLSPRILQSGTSLNRSYISRCSAGEVRSILYLSSIRGVLKIPQLSEMYDRLLSKGKKRMQARCACMRKMLLIMRGLVVKKELYDKKYWENFSKNA